MFDANARPFTALLRALHAKTGSLEAVSRRCGHVRSTTWIQRLLRSGSPWTWTSPPGPRTWPKFAQAFGISVEEVRRAIAREWLEVEAVPPPLTLENVLPLYEGLTLAQQQLIATLLMELRVNGRSIADPPPTQAA